MGKMCGADIGDKFPWPTCSVHYELVTTHENFFSWAWASLAPPHGPIHNWIGGT